MSNHYENLIQDVARGLLGRGKKSKAKKELAALRAQKEVSRRDQEKATSKKPSFKERMDQLRTEEEEKKKPSELERLHEQLREARRDRKPTADIIKRIYELSDPLRDYYTDSDFSLSGWSNVGDGEPDFEWQPGAPPARGDPAPLTDPQYDPNDPVFHYPPQAQPSRSDARWDEWMEEHPPGAEAAEAADRRVQAPLKEQKPVHYQAGPGEKTALTGTQPEGPVEHLKHIAGTQAPQMHSLPTLEQFMQFQPGAMTPDVTLKDFLGAVMDRKSQERDIIDNKDPTDKVKVKIIVTIFNPQPKRHTIHKTLTLSTLQNIRPYISSVYAKNRKTAPGFISDSVVSKEGFDMVANFLGIPTSVRAIRIDSIFGESGETFFSVE